MPNRNRVPQSAPKPQFPRPIHHKASGQARVRLGGKDVYLGRWGSPEATEAYDRALAEWLAAGRPVARPKAQPEDGPTVADLAAAYWRHAETYYRGNSELNCIRLAMRPLVRLYGDVQASDFSPLKLKSLREHLIQSGLTRSGVNSRIGRVKRMYRWGVGEELVPAGVLHALQAVDGLRFGRTAARETDPVRPVPLDVIEQTLPHLPPVARDLVQLQLLLGCRPGELLDMRPADVDCSRSPWVYRPQSHKNRFRGHDRAIFVGPRAQELLEKYMTRDPETHCFSPQESEQQRRDIRTAARKTPLNQGNRTGTNRRKQPKRKPHGRYGVAAYRRAVHRACDLAFPPPAGLDTAAVAKWKSQHRWGPHRLRHSRATELRQRYGLEVAGAVLGHRNLETAAIYAEKNITAAARAAQETG
jgi:integrase